ncbi:MAG: hypothetical protein PHT62_14485 [Desulfotomaculaceae bacterium]|nr:hypothetical protein [Desulfotomaculaceae bacterium]
MQNIFKIGEVVYQKTKYGMVKSKIVKIINESYAIIDKGYGEQKVRIDQLIKENLDDEMAAKEQEILNKLQKEFMGI